MNFCKWYTGIFLVAVVNIHGVERIPINIAPFIGSIGNDMELAFVPLLNGVQKYSMVIAMPASERSEIIEKHAAMITFISDVKALTKSTFTLANARRDEYMGSCFCGEKTDVCNDARILLIAYRGVHGAFEFMQEDMQRALWQLEEKHKPFFEVTLPVIIDPKTDVPAANSEQSGTADNAAPNASDQAALAEAPTKE